jgi:hypothetical protein
MAKLRQKKRARQSPLAGLIVVGRTHELNVGSASAFQATSPWKTSEWNDQESGRRLGEASTWAACEVPSTACSATAQARSSSSTGAHGLSTRFQSSQCGVWPLQDKQLGIVSLAPSLHR